MPKRIVFPSKGQVELQSFDLPELAPEDVLVRTLYSVISIGTETTILHQNYARGTHFDNIFSFPQLKTGMQAVGVVDRVGETASRFQKGETVFMRMAHGSHQVLPEHSCSPVPPNIDLKAACWCGLAKTAFRAAWAGNFAAQNAVLIVGTGPVGQLTVRWASAMGVAEVVAVDMSEYRLQLALRGGATRTIAGALESASASIAQMNGGDGPSLVVDTTGNAAVFAQCLAVAAKFGKLILLGDSGHPQQQCLTSDAMTKGLTIQVTHDSHDLDGWTQDKVDQQFLELVGAGKINLDGLITHEFSPAECAHAYALASENRHQAVGILYDWKGHG